MERESRQHHQWVKDHPTESQTPSLLERLNTPKRIKKSGIPLQERLSDRLKPLLSRLGQGRPRNHKPYLRLVKSLPQNQPRMNNSNQTHLGISRGNPRVFGPLPVPVPMETRPANPRVYPSIFIQNGQELIEICLKHF